MQNSTTVSVATYNILNPFFAVKWGEIPGLNEVGRAASKEALSESTAVYESNAWTIYSNWDERCPSACSNIQLADIVCLQEISEETLQMVQNLTKYQLAGAGYHYFPGGTKYGNAILYKEEKVSLKEASEITYENLPAIRSAASGVFETNNKVFRVMSVHLSGYYPGESDLQKKQMAKKRGFDELQSFKKQVEETAIEGLEGIVIAGDFNESQDEEHAELYRPGFLMESGYRCDGSFNVTEPLKNRKIDWLFYKSLTHNEPTLTSMGLERLQKPASDHLMTGTLIEWKA